VIIKPRGDHGTRACYVGGCRCDACRSANTERHRRRQRLVVEAASSVQPSGPALEGTLVRDGATHRIRRCPGANGAPCVRDGGTWLRGPHAVCRPCVERVTVWDGCVPVDRARKHLLKLRRLGIGRRAVAAASDVAETTLMDVVARRAPIRASTERRILAVDEGAIADHGFVEAATANGLLAKMRQRGFTGRHLAELLGQRKGANSTQLGARPQMTAMMRLRVQKLWARIERGEIVPERAMADATTEARWLLGLINRGTPETWLSTRLGFRVTRVTLENMSDVRKERLAVIHALQADVAAALREDNAGMPEYVRWDGPGGLEAALKSAGER